MTPRIFVPGQEAQLMNYARALRRAGGLPCFSLNPGRAMGCAGLLLPGGGDLDPALYGQANHGSHPPDRERDRLELELLELFLRAGKPVLGICRGLQVINVFFGGTLLQDIRGHGQVDGHDRLHRVTAAPGSLSARFYGPSFLVNSAHHQAADRLGAGLEATSRAEDGTVEALRHGTLPLWALQWHPERLFPSVKAETVDGELVFEYFTAKCRENLQETS